MLAKLEIKINYNSAIDRRGTEIVFQKEVNIDFLPIKGLVFILVDIPDSITSSLHKVLEVQILMNKFNRKDNGKPLIYVVFEPDYCFPKDRGLSNKSLDEYKKAFLDDEWKII